MLEDPVSEFIGVCLEEGGGGSTKPEDGFGRRGGVEDDCLDDDEDMIATNGRLVWVGLLISDDDVDGGSKEDQD